MSTETIYQAYIETEKYSVYMEYSPLPDGLIEIVSVSIEARPVSPFEQRRAKHRRGLVLNAEEEQAEAMQPTARLEQLNLF